MYSLLKSFDCVWTGLCICCKDIILLIEGKSPYFETDDKESETGDDDCPRLNT